MNNNNITVLYGAVAHDAPADEQDVLVEVDTVCAALERLGYQTHRLPITLNLEAARDQLYQNRTSLIFNLVESVAGQGCYIHLAPTLLAALDLRYTGSSLPAMLLSSNKLLAKHQLKQAGLPTPAWYSSDIQSWEHYHAGPWLIKSVWEHASIGLHDDALVCSGHDLIARLKQRQSRFGGDWFAETYVDGREFNLALLAGAGGFEVLAPAEMLFREFPAGKPKIVGYAAKWDAASYEYQHTVRSFEAADSDRALLKKLKKLALHCAELFQLRAYARIDFRVDQAGRPWVIDINANPCLAPDGGFMAAASASGLDTDAVIARIIGDATDMPVPNGFPASQSRMSQRSVQARA